MADDATQAASSAAESTSTVSSAPATASPPQNGDAAQVASSTPDAKSPADSSTAAGAKDATAPKRSVLDVVRDVVDPKAKGQTQEKSPTSEKGNETKPDAAADASDKDTKAETKDEDLPFHNHPRWKEVIQERDTYKVGHENYKRMTDFMTVSGLSGEEVGEGFDVMALMKHDPVKAKAKLEEYLGQINLYLGETLSPDLRQKVETGALDEASAKELHLARVRAQTQETRATQAERTVQQTEVQTRVTSAANAVTAWERNLMARDPDYATKQMLVQDRFKVLVAEKGSRGFPQTPEAAVAIAQQALTDVEKTLRPVLQKTRTATKPIASQTASVSEQPRPKTVREAVSRGLATAAQ